jgi:formylglycine-generating enzyme
MVYVPPGALVVGTPPDRRPRRADRELAGEQVMLDGYYIDQFAYPNEEGAIPVTNVSHSEAAGLWPEGGKRLCSELEWERACKGPDNRTFEYGDSYREETCRTGRQAALIPSGYNVGCQSDFGVHDLHGGPFEWTLDSYGRGSEQGEVVVKGGNARDGEVAGRCANLEPEDPNTRSGAVGFRCCAGPPNAIRIELEKKFAPGLIARVSFDEEVEKSLISNLPEEAKKTLLAGGPIRRERVWLWRPVANEELHLIALCGRGPKGPRATRCGLFLARLSPARVQALAWVESGQWVANLHRPGPREMLFLIGGDQRGSFKRLIRYRTGDVSVGELSWGGVKSITRSHK